ncbi:MAG: hypothetical protein AB8E82_20840 [Aureispira sp.]
MYLRTLAAILTKKFEDGQTVPFSLILNHVYNGLDESRSAKIPFFLLGNPKGGESNWKKFRETPLEGGKKQKDFMLVGDCTLQGKTLVLDVNKSKGLNKLSPKTKARLENVLRKIDSEYAISFTDVSVASEEEETDTATATVAAGAAATTGSDTSEQEMSVQAQKIIDEYKKEETEKATKLSDNITQLTALFKGKLQEIAQNVENNRVTRSDIKAIQEINAAYDETVKLYNDAGKQVKGTFAAAYKKLEDGKELLIKLSLTVKERKKSLADLTAESYYQHSEGRPPTSEEVDNVQGLLKDTLDQNKKGLRAPQDKVLRATSYVLKRVGVEKFKPEYVEQTVEKSIVRE